jgi:hypothetical protein
MDLTHIKINPASLKMYISIERHFIMNGAAPQTIFTVFLNVKFDNTVRLYDIKHVIDGLSKFESLTMSWLAFDYMKAQHRTFFNSYSYFDLVF